MATETTQETGTGDDVDPIIAAVISLIIPGVGHIYASESGDDLRTRGIYWLGGIIAYYVLATVLSFVLIGFLLFLVAPLVHIGSAVDAYMQLSE